MAPARRNYRRRDWPRGLYEPRPGYYVWREPGRNGEPGKTHALGEVSFAVARNEALQANAYLAEQRPNLVARLQGADKTMADALDAMPAAQNANTAKQDRSTDKRIRTLWGNRTCASMTIKDVAEALETLTPAAALQLRVRLVRVFRKAQAKGWCATNPAEATERPKPQVKRGRLTLETFRAIRAECAPWVQRAFDVALVLGCDASTLETLHRRMVCEFAGVRVLDYVRVKTGKRIAVPLTLELRAAGLRLADLVPQRIGYFVQDPDPHGNAGDRVTGRRISRYFAEARERLGMPGPDVGGPSFHEIRSLAKRLYIAQGDVDHLMLLGHASERMGDLYADPRGVEPTLVRIA